MRGSSCHSVHCDELNNNTDFPYCDKTPSCVLFVVNNTEKICKNVENVTGEFLSHNWLFTLI
jgi:hypothetical protein